MRRVLAEAAAVGTATSRALLFDPRASEGFAYYDRSAWENQMWVGGYNFETPPPLVTDEGIKPFAPTGVRALHSRVAWFYGYTGVTPAMCMRLTGVGSQYVFAFKDADGSLKGASSAMSAWIPVACLERAVSGRRERVAVSIAGPLEPARRVGGRVPGQRLDLAALKGTGGSGTGRCSAVGAETTRRGGIRG
jgi:hypothetical protein